MSSSIQYTKVFNMKVKEMARDLILVFPEDEDLRFLTSAMNIATMQDEHMMVSLFYTNVTKKYGQGILNRDETFFLEKDYEELSNSSWSMKLVEKLKFYWTKLDTENKEAMWKYMHVLVALSEKIDGPKDKA